MTAFGQLVCGQCGMDYAPSADGRWIHRQIFGHSPSAAQPSEPDGVSGPCKRGDHSHCPERWGGGFMRPDGPSGCACKCGHPESLPRGPRPQYRPEPDEVA